MVIRLIESRGVYTLLTLVSKSTARAVCTLPCYFAAVVVIVVAAAFHARTPAAAGRRRPLTALEPASAATEPTAAPCHIAGAASGSGWVRGATTGECDTKLPPLPLAPAPRP